jgi:hypothetical protein
MIPGTVMDLQRAEGIALSIFPPTLGPLLRFGELRSGWRPAENQLQSSDGMPATVNVGGS